MIQTLQLSPGVTLRCFQDNRFKQGCLSIQLLRPVIREDMAVNALIPAILLRGTQKHPDLRQITLHLDTLYGASTGALVRKVGDLQTIGIYGSFLDDRYALEGGNILESMIEFMGQLLLEPLLVEGSFCPDFVESEKRNLILAIQSNRNDKRQYAASQLMKHMCSRDSLGIPRLGEESQVAAITAQSAYDHYLHILRTSPVMLFYVGSQEPEQVAKLLEPLVSRLAPEPMPLPVQAPFQDPAGGEHTEYMEVTQGKLCVGFTTPVTMPHPDFAAMQVLNALFGGGMTSKLFMNVREKLSLCYDIGSGYRGTKGIMTVSAGIDFDQKDAVLTQIRQQLESCCKGDFTPEELESARQGLLTQLQSTHDSPGAIENYYATGLLSNLNRTPDQYMAQIRAVTAQQVAEVAKTLQEHTIYFLRGQR